MMKAARYYGQKDIRVDDVPEPNPGPGEIKIKIVWNGICGTDLHEYITGAKFTPQEGYPHPISGALPPVTLGHEMVGVISAVGSAVKETFQVGQKVVVDPVVSCKHCSTCQTLDAPNLCHNIGLIGLTGWGGGLAEYICVSHENVHIVPDHVPFEEAACTEPLTVAWHAVNCSGFQTGQTVFIAGAGPIGLFIVKVLKARGAKKIIISEPALSRRERSMKHGADHAIDPNKVTPEEEVMKMTGNVGVDVSFDCAGISATVNSCIISTRYTGTICIVSSFEKPASIEMTALLMGERRLVASCCNNRCFPDVIKALADGSLGVFTDLITRRIPLTSVVHDGFEALLQDRDNQIKILVGSGSMTS